MQARLTRRQLMFREIFEEALFWCQKNVQFALLDSARRAMWLLDECLSRLSNI